MTAVMPEIDACSTGRPTAAALIWLNATCWAEFGERRYERLFVATMIAWAPVLHRLPHEGRERGLEADHGADRLALDPEHLGRVPGVEVGWHLLQLADEAEDVSERDVLTERDEVLLRVGAQQPPVGS